MFRVRFWFCFWPLALVAAAAGDEITRSVIVQPIVVAGDDGSGPSHMRIVERRIDDVFRPAGIDFQFLESVRLHSTAARDGEVDLKGVVQLAREARVLRGDGELLNAFFVRAVKGGKHVPGRESARGATALVALGEPAGEALDAFALARQFAYCLGLLDASQDPQLRLEEHNLMGDGSPAQRIGPNALNSNQIDIIRQSPLVRPRIECLSLEDARRQVLDESFEPYFSQLQQREIAALTGTVVDADSLDACRDEARRRFQAAVLPFDDREQEALEWLATELDKRLAGDFPLLVAQPWRFLKVQNHLCSGFSHTRGTCIIFSQSTIRRAVQSHLARRLDRLGPLLLHEKLHVVQRCFPERFAGLYQEVMGFRRADVEPNDWITRRQIANPDAMRLEWIVADAPPGEEGRSFFWIRTILKGEGPVPVMGRDFLNIAVKLEHSETGFRAMTDDDGKPQYVLPSEVPGFAERFATRRGLDHPNEIAAYEFAEMCRREYLDPDGERTPDATKEFERLSAPFRAWCRGNL